MKFLSFRTLLLMLILAFVFNSCKNETDIPEKEKISIIGKWKMYGSAVYGLEFTN